MANKCVITPRVRTSSGVEVDSSLFKKLNSVFGRGIAIDIYCYTKSDNFNNEVSNLEYDENGEPTFESLDRELNLMNNLAENTDMSEVNRTNMFTDEDGNRMYFPSKSSAYNEAVDFNENNDGFTAEPKVDSEGIYLDVRPSSRSMVKKSDIVFKSSLNNELLMIMNRLGFDVSLIDDDTINGVFDPENAPENAKNLIEIIKVAKGERGEAAFNEEFCHFMIEGLQKVPVVYNFINSITNDVAKEVLGEMYGMYKDEYEGDFRRMQKEVAGKLLSEKVSGSSTNVARQKKTILERILNFISSIFRNGNVKDIENAISKAKDNASKVAGFIRTDNIYEQFDKNLVLSGQKLYQLDSATAKLKELATISIGKLEKRMAIENIKFGGVSARSARRKKKAQDFINNQKYAEAVIYLAEDALKFISEQSSKIENNLIGEEERLSRSSEDDRKKLNDAATILLSAKTFCDGYDDIILELSQLEKLNNDEDLGIDDEVIERINEVTSALKDCVDSIRKGYANSRKVVVKAAIRPYFGDSREINGVTITLDQFLTEIDKDISLNEVLLYNIENSSDMLHQMIHSMFVEMENRRDREIRRINKKIKAIHDELHKATGSNDTSFMYQVVPIVDRDGNVRDGLRIISPYDWTAFTKDFNEAKKEIAKRYKKGSKRYRRAVREWFEEHTDPVALNPEEEDEDEIVMDRVPKGYLLAENPVDKLTAPQKRYYESMIALKKELQNKSSHTNTYTPIYLPKSNVKTIMESGGSLTDRLDAVKETVKSSIFASNEDQEMTNYQGGFGTITKRVLDFNNKPINTIGVQYTHEIELNRISRDFTSSMIAFNATSCHYEEAKKILNIMEVIREQANERRVLQKDKGAVIVDKLARKVNDSPVPLKMTLVDSNMAKMLDSAYDAFLYHRFKMGSKGWQVPFSSKVVNPSKTSDTIKNLVTHKGLGYNMFSASVNITVGRIQMFIEAAGGKYFGFKDWTSADKEYYIKLMPSYFKNINKTNPDDKLHLLIERFDPMNEWYDEQGRSEAGNIVERSLGKMGALVGQSAGEHMLHCVGTIAMLKHIKVKKAGDDNGKTNSLYDIIDVKKESLSSTSNASINSLYVKSGYVDAVTGEAIDEDYLDIANRKIKAINKQMHGNFSGTGKGMLQRYAAGRLVMQFKQWMPATYARRFAKKRWDEDLQEYTEGYYVTFAKAIAEDLQQKRLPLIANWKNMNNWQKYQIRKALAEIGITAGIAFACQVLSGYKDKHNWAINFGLYNLMKARQDQMSQAFFYLEPSSMWKLFKEPTATFNFMTDLSNAFEVSAYFETVKSGRHKGWNKGLKNLYSVLPYAPAVEKFATVDVNEDIFNVFDR